MPSLVFDAKNRKINHTEYTALILNCHKLRAIRAIRAIAYAKSHNNKRNVVYFSYVSDRS